MTGRINKPLPHPYDDLFKNGEDSIENSETAPQNISMASEDTRSETCPRRSCGLSPLCLAAVILIILEIHGRDDQTGI